MFAEEGEGEGFVGAEGLDMWAGGLGGCKEGCGCRCGRGSWSR